MGEVVRLISSERAEVITDAVNNFFRSVEGNLSKPNTTPTTRVDNLFIKSPQPDDQPIVGSDHVSSARQSVEQAFMIPDDTVEEDKNA